MSARVICFACAALKQRGDKLDVYDRYRIAVRCECGGITGADYRAMRAEMNAREPENGVQS